MRKSNEKDIAAELYISGGKTLKEISQLTGISENTLSKWANAEGKTWKKRKQDIDTSPLRLKELLLSEAEKLAKGEKTTLTDFDGLSKCVAAIDRIDKKFKITPIVIQNVFKDYDLWLAGIDNAKAKEGLKYHKQYLTEKIKQEIDG